MYSTYTPNAFADAPFAAASFDPRNTAYGHIILGRAHRLPERILELGPKNFSLPVLDKLNYEEKIKFSNEFGKVVAHDTKAFLRMRNALYREICRSLRELRNSRTVLCRWDGRRCSFLLPLYDGEIFLAVSQNRGRTILSRADVEAHERQTAMLYVA